MKWNGSYNFSRWSHGPCFTDVSLAKQKRKHLKTPQIDFFLWRSIYINQRYKHRKQIINALYYELIGNKLRIRYLNTYQEFENN